MFGIGLGSAEDSAVSAVVNSFLESKLAMFGAAVVVAFIVGYLCISDSCQLTMPVNTLTKLLSKFNGGDASVSIKGTQWIKKTNFEICICPVNERKCALKTWFDAIWPSSKHDEMALNKVPKPKSSSLESERDSDSQHSRRSSVDPESEWKPNTVDVPRPKSWFRTLADCVMPHQSKSKMSPGHQEKNTSDTSPRSSQIERPASEHSLKSYYLPEVSKSSSGAEKSLKSNGSKSVSSNSLNEPNKSKSGLLNLWNEPKNAKSANLIEEPLKSHSSETGVSKMSTDSTQIEKSQKSETKRSSHGPTMPVYGNFLNSDPVGTNFDPDNPRPKNCNKPIAITAVVCVTLTVLLMSGLFALMKANSEEIKQFGERLAQIYMNVFQH